MGGMRDSLVHADKLNGEPKPLSSEELKGGGWRCAEAGKEIETQLNARGLFIISKNWRQKKYIRGCMSSVPGFAVQFSEACAVDLDHLKQIHRIGNNFYWGAPSDQTN